jgi:hypothetical protein
MVPTVPETPSTIVVLVTGEPELEFLAHIFDIPLTNSNLCVSWPTLVSLVPHAVCRPFLHKYRKTASNHSPSVPRTVSAPPYEEPPELGQVLCIICLSIRAIVVARGSSLNEARAAHPAGRWRCGDARAMRSRLCVFAHFQLCTCLIHAHRVRLCTWSWLAVNLML